MPTVHNLGEIVDRQISPETIWMIEVGPDDAPNGAPGDAPYDAWGKTVRQITYGEFHKAADGVARALLSRGLQRGQSVGILAGNSAEYLLAYFGIMRAGLTAVPINYKLPQSTITHILNDAEVQLVFVDAANKHLVGDLTQIAMDQPAAWDAFLDPGPLTPLAMREAEAANILYTSGSSGLPKGVPLTHGGYVWAAELMCQSFPPMADKRVLVAAPLYHMNGLVLSSLTAMTGGTTVMMRQFSAIGYLQAAATHQCHILTSVPTMIAMAVREPETIARLDLSSVERVIMGSAPVSEALFDKAGEIFPNAVVSNSWGTTESSPVAFGLHPGGMETPKLSIGYPGDHSEIKLMHGADENEGVMWIRNKAVMPGYLNRPEETEKSLADGWYDTGDVMRRDENGFFFFVGRADDMFVCGGENIYPAEVERLLESHPGIAQAAVIALADEIKQQIPVAFVVAKPNAAPTPEDIKQFALANGPAYQHPRFVAVLPELPLAGTNKIDRRALFEHAAAEFIR
ncbi:MAG: acyl--CoA ligase [Rhodospirillaceae bacterium]|jgi:long-chain acyl-CoA synthetase|nr:acyl--CoA ligase [Rhodospirillaceae bacterium]MBT4045624.1 acyl--CoA ligase [Rhodospirillaceae bacterium]MBT4691573.1 acyl--CoA ligase [Rhodospirillaceae bacterium]MBT5083064.1 acyl--CoA ligase [Rhodospirillaceae bacterium]MBT5524508.1 acyl--CoA ligase [Rhodospirillaceae bacterium]